MQTMNIGQSLPPQTGPEQTPALRDGQMVYAKINKIYSNQTAEISIGANKYTAMLDAPIAVGERYWFQVQQTGDTTALKVLPGNGGSQSIKDMAIQLLQHLSIHSSKESMLLAQFFVKNQMPVTKEEFSQALQFLSMPEKSNQVLNVLKTMHSLNLPMNESIFKALFSLEEKMPMHTSIQTLMHALEMPENEAEQNLKGVLSYMMESPADKVAERGLKKLYSTWLASKGELKDHLFRILQNIGMFPKNSRQEDVIMDALIDMAKSGRIVKNPSIQEAALLLGQLNKNEGIQEKQIELVSQLRNKINERIVHTPQSSDEYKLWKSLKQLWEQTNMNSHTGHTVVRSSGEQTRQSTSSRITAAGNQPMQASMNIVPSAKQLLLYIQSTVNEISSSKENLQILSKSAGAENGYRLPKQQIINLLSKSEVSPMEDVYNHWDRQLITKVLYAERQQLQQPSSALIGNEIKQAIRLLGLGFEHYLAHTEKGSAIKEQELMTLKPLLMKVLAETQNPAVKEHAEQLLNKITGQQILSNQTGPLQHFFMQIPFSFGHFRSDVSMQWSGRESSNGEIDPSFCRVLFYLDLEHLNETVIDMVVQNRVMKIEIKNEHANVLKKISSPYMKICKEKLEEIGYKVSGVSFEEPANDFSIQDQVDLGKLLEGQPSYNGVDIRI
ncbi:hypothetical protein [Bacillus sp. 1P06AnD]|uniref:hypothetical protein n=1 Tax=Bacillus sp. 1P06AnD TaxID=3132208 RepID=UPI0039A3CB16